MILPEDIAQLSGIDAVGKDPFRFFNQVEQVI